LIARPQRLSGASGLPLHGAERRQRDRRIRRIDHADTGSHRIGARDCRTLSRKLGNRQNTNEEHGEPDLQQSPRVSRLEHGHIENYNAGRGADERGALIIGHAHV
jgi:hypothetical protein